MSQFALAQGLQPRTPSEPHHEPHGSIGPRASISQQAGSKLELPQEIVDYIIDFLHEDREALKSCTTVSRQWQEAARYHLFSSIVVRSTLGGAGFDEFLRSIQLETIKPFAAYLRRLTLGTKFVFCSPLVTIHTLRTILLNLPNLKELRLVLVALADGRPPELETFAQPTYHFKLEHLTMQNVGRHSQHRPQHFLQVLGLFSEIGTLHIKFLFSRDTATSTLSEELNVSKLSDSIPTELRVSNFSCLDFAAETQFWLEVLRRTASVQTLTTLHVQSSLLLMGATSLALLLQDVGPNLRFLGINTNGTPEIERRDPDMLFDALNLSACNRLEVFQVGLPRALEWTFICRLLSCLTCQQTLHTVKLHYQPILYEADNEEEWKLMRAALAPFSTMREIVFVADLQYIVSLRHLENA